LLHSGVNYYQFHSALNILVENGTDKAEVFNILAQGKYNLQWEQILGQSELSNLLQSYNVPAVGASGAIYGLLVAFAFMVPNAELSLMFIPIPIKAKYFVPGILAIDLFLGFKGSSIFGAGSTGIAHFAHIGGALTGFIMMWFWKKNQFNHNRWN
jgi:membrane associated rhomboid family serine protease